MGWLAQAMRDLHLGKTSAFRDSLTAFLASIPYDSHPGLRSMDLMEKHFQYTFYLLVRLMGVYSRLLIEKAYSQGRVDCILETQRLSSA